MLTTVILDGEMGKRFGREHRLNIKSPRQALRLIDVNQGGLCQWIDQNAKKFSAYRITCEYMDGRKEQISEETYMTTRGKIKTIRFTPTIMGAGGKDGGFLAIAVGAMMIVASFFFPAASTFLLQAGLGLAMSGVSSLLAPKPKTSTDSEAKKTESHYFSGAENPTDQGQAVPLIYGRIRTGAQAVSAGMTIDQLK